jgi:phosphatidylglycerol---prolipoprotein diacylglyceryl transferase
MLIHPEIDPIALQIGPLAIRWYGLTYLAAFGLFMLLGAYRARKQILQGWKPADIDELLLYGILGVVLGGRIGYCLFYKPGYYLSHPLEIFYVWQGGMRIAWRDFRDVALCAAHRATVFAGNGFCVATGAAGLSVRADR